MMLTSEQKQQYEDRYPKLLEIAAVIETELQRIIKPLKHIDSLSVRVKSIPKFVEKANRKDYSNPLRDIQDQIGARIVVIFLDDIEIVKNEVVKEFHAAENGIREPDKPNQFDYEAYHVLCVIPLDVRSQYESPVEVFELQIATLFQHAWAEANHDLAYKPNDPNVDRETARKIAWAAAQAWGADRIFNEIYSSKKKDQPQHSGGNHFSKNGDE